jgi:hypothetical protein
MDRFSTSMNILVSLRTADYHLNGELVGIKIRIMDSSQLTLPDGGSL